MPDSPSDVRLQELERRWQHDRSPRVFLQYADELRRAGRTTRAIEVLTEGLERHPDSVSGMVALGKTLLEADEPEHARTFLERAIELDPSQYVANRLLVECSLRLGDVESARERLGICRLLNDRDPELETLAAEIEARQESAGGADAPPAAAPIFELPEPEPLPTIELSRAAEAGVADAEAAARRRSAPFGDLGAATEASRRILSHIRSEGIFARSEASAVVEEHADEEPAPTPIASRVEEAAPETAEPIERPATAASGSESEVVAPLEPAPVPEPSAPPPVQPMFSLQSIGAEVESEEGPGAAVEAGLVEGGGDDDLDELPEVEPRTAPSTTDGAAAETATLGNLYLAQGHLDEAERAFRAALDRRSDDAVARRGLEEIERRRADAVVPATPVVGGGPTQRRIALLSGWMNRLRSERLARRARVS